MKFLETFRKQGKQGLVGLVEKDDTKVVFKISQYINHLVQHEYTIMKGLGELSPYCPHFCKSVGVENCTVDPRVRKSGNPFEITSSNPIQKDVLLLEYIENSSKFYNYFSSNKISDNIIYSTIKQVLVAINIAQKEKEFTHYDLHSLNIMMKRCSKDTVFLYVLDEDTQICIPTFGHYPVIIDFGFSYISDMKDDYLWPSMGHTDVGFTSDRFDPVADPKLFLVSVAEDLRRKRNNSASKKFNKIVKNLYRPLDIDWETGWDNNENDSSLSSYATELLEEFTESSELFQNYDHYCIDLLSSLIILPFEEQNYDNISDSFTLFLKEFYKIESEVNNDFYSLCILKSIVDAARSIRNDYINLETRNASVSWFEKNVSENVSKLAKFCRMKGVDFEKMLCGLLNLARDIEGLFFDIMKSYTRDKEKLYKKLPITDVEKLYKIVEVNIPDTYVFKEETKVVVFDSIKKKNSVLSISTKNIRQINKISPLERGKALYGLYLK